MVSAPEVRAAKSFLHRKGVFKKHWGQISPRMFATYCKVNDIGFQQAFQELMEKSPADISNLGLDTAPH